MDDEQTPHTPDDKKQGVQSAHGDSMDDTSAFVPGETPVVEPGSSLPSFLMHSDVSDSADADPTDNPKPLDPRFEVIDGGTSMWDALGIEPVTNTKAAGVVPLAETVAEARNGEPDAGERVREAAEGAANAARALGTLMSQGASAVKQVSAAKRALADAQGELDTLDERIASQERELAHRNQVHGSFDQIVAQQRAAIQNAENSEAAAEAQRDALQQKVNQLKQQLKSMREEDAQTEKRLKAAVEAAEAEEAESREASSRLTRRLDDANRLLASARSERESGLAAARQTVQSCEARLETLRAEFAEVQRNPSANSANYTVRATELSAQIDEATKKLNQANEDLPRIESELNRALQTAQNAVAAAQAPIDEAKRGHQSVTGSADTAREEYRAAKEQASERHRAMREQISNTEKSRREQETAIEDARKAAADAQALIDHATDINEHPEVTQALAGALDRDKRERQEQAQEVSKLIAAEANVRELTRGSRLKFIGIIAGAIVIVAALTFLIFSLLNH